MISKIFLLVVLILLGIGALYAGEPIILNAEIIGSVSAIMVAIVSAISAIVAAVIKNQLNKNFTTFYDKLHEFKEENEKQHGSIKDRIENITQRTRQNSIDIKKLSDDMQDLKEQVFILQDAFREYKRKEKNNDKRYSELMRIVAEKIALFDDEELRQFAQFKASIFADFVSKQMERDLNYFAMLGIKETGMAISEQIRREGKNIVHNGFVDFFYKTHAKKVEEFFDDLIAASQQLDSIVMQDYFYERSKTFLENFIISIGAEYSRYLKEKISSQGNSQELS